MSGQTDVTKLIVACRNFANAPDYLSLLQLLVCGCHVPDKDASDVIYVTDKDFCLTYNDIVV